MDQILKLLHGLDLIKLWVWEVDEVVPIVLIIIKPWELLLCCLYCYAMLVDVDWVSVSMTDVRIVNKWLT